MAQANNEAPLKLSEDTQRLLARIGCTGYSLHGYQPSAGEWRLTIDQIREIIENISKTYLDDLRYVTIEVDHSRGNLYAYVWIPVRSKHITNNDLNNGNAAVRKPMTVYSKPMKEFMDKFCEKSRKRLIPEEHGNEVRGIEVEIERFLKIEFDENAYEYGKITADRFKRRTRLNFRANFLSGDDNRYGKLQYLEVRKEVKSFTQNYQPRPRRSYNAR
jgi:hypothetical protein